ncbi:MAG: MxaK protein [Betaproteobacteria bacterium]
MRRRTVHALFGAACATLAVLAATRGLRVAQAERVERAIAHATEPAAPDRAVPQARLARALALGAAGRYEAALAEHKALIQGEQGALKEAALYDLGNLHLREALKAGTGDAAAALPLVELAKQSYRDALRIAPADWDARYNLERALQLAPEIDEDAPDDAEPPSNKERTITTAPAGRSDLP